MVSKVGRKRLHPTPAARQAAYRQRVQALHVELEAFHMAVRRLSERGQALYLNPHDCLGADAEETLRKVNEELLK